MADVHRNLGFHGTWNP